MADKRKARKKKEEVVDKPLKAEYEIAKYLRSHLPVKKTSLLSHKVEYFTACKAVDCLLESPWGTGNKSKEIFFSSREATVDYLNVMLIHKFFHRARKIPVLQKDEKRKKKSRGDDEGSEDKMEKKKDGKKKEGEKKKEKRKIKLDMHLEQVFIDGNEAYVWIYDPIPKTAWLIGGLLVVGSILLCLFPLWPSSVRKGVYYISILAAGFLCIIVALIIFRVLMFCLIWLLTLGKHHLWILPNLTEDVGFFESFWPLFKYEYKGAENEANFNDDDCAKKATDNKKGTDDEEKDESDEKDKFDRSDERDSDGPTDTDHESVGSRHGEECSVQPESANGFEIVNQEDVVEGNSVAVRKRNLSKDTKMRLKIS